MNSVALAYRILLHFEQAPGTNLRHLLQQRLASVSGGRAAAPYRMVAGTIRHQRRLDHLVDHWSSISSGRIEPRVRVLLRLGLHLLTASDSTPDHAAVNQSVALASPRARGFVNALLRRAARSGAETARLLDEIQDPSVRFSLHPQQVAELSRFAPPGETLFSWLNREPVFHLSPAPGHPIMELKEKLDALSIPHRRIPGLSLFQVDTAGPVLRAIVSPRLGYLQNTASRLVSLAAVRHGNTRILDGCAAPGTKSLAIKTLRPELHLVSHDRHPGRLAKMTRLPGVPQGGGSWTRACGDMQTPPFRNAFDLVLLDAPCTSIGTARKNPDLKLRVDQAAIRAAAEQQMKILNAAVNQFPGSLILYSVCSFAHAEGEGVMEKLASIHPLDFHDLGPWARALGFSVHTEGFGITLLPAEELQNDLFYLALFRVKKRG